MGASTTKAEITGPFGLIVDGTGDVYIADTADSLIRFVTAAGKITAVVGTYNSGANFGYAGATEGLPPARPSIVLRAVALDSNGNLYIADTSNNVIRKLTASTGVITTVAGNNVQRGYFRRRRTATSKPNSTTSKEPRWTRRATSTSRIR